MSVRVAGNIMQDNQEDIDANKICNVLDQDDPKDFFGLYTIIRIVDSNWATVILPLQEDAPLTWRNCVSNQKFF